MPTVLTAATASITFPGPTGSPAARKARAKCIRLASSDPPASGVAGLEVGGATGPGPMPLRHGWTRSGQPRPARSGVPWMTGSSPVMTVIWVICSGRSRRRNFGLDLLQEPSGFAAVQPRDVVLVFEQHAEGVVDRMRRQLEHVELHQRLGPVDRLGDARQFEQIHAAQFLDKTDDLARQAFAGAGRLALQDLELARGGRIVDPVVKAAPLHRIVDLAGVVGGDD